MIEALGLGKRYGERDAVVDVTFTVRSPCVVGLLGPNGAGKTSIIRILSGAHLPSSGDARLAGISVWEDPLAIKALVGYLPENAPLYPEMTVAEYLRFIADVRGLSRKEGASAIDGALSQCALADVFSTTIGTLSKGYKQRVAFAQAILHDPSVLILDEPTTGLDPNQILALRDLIRRLGQSKIVVLSTHLMAEVEAICSSAIILNRGRLVASGSVDDIVSRFSQGLGFSILVKVPPLVDVSWLSSHCSSLGVCSEPQPSGDAQFSFTARLERGGGPEVIFDWAVSRGLKILTLTPLDDSLEGAFVKLTGGDL